jgi:Malectin domain
MCFTERYYTTPSSRVFNVLVEGDVVKANLNPIKESNKVAVSVVKTITVGSVDIELEAILENPNISSFTITEGIAPLLTPATSTNNQLFLHFYETNGQEEPRLITALELQEYWRAGRDDLIQWRQC